MRVKVGLGVAALCLMMVPLVMSAAVMSSLAGSFRSSPRQCGRDGRPASAGGVWTEGQRANAAAIVQAGAALQVPPRGWVIAVATAMQESSLTNVAHGDTAGPDSRGLFQQRNSWGPEVVRMDPTGAAGLFYARLVALPGWEAMPLSRAAQSVQISAFPDAYARWEDDAQTLVGELAGSATSAQALCGISGPVDGWALPLDPAHIHPPMRPHHDYAAVDIGVEVGQPVFAMRGGTATEIRGGACGYGVAVTDAEGAEWIYCHASMLATVGGSVTAGQEIMRSGGAPGIAGAGSSTGPHLHVQVRFGGVMRCVGAAVDQLAAGKTPLPVAEWATSGCSY